MNKFLPNVFPIKARSRFFFTLLISGILLNACKVREKKMMVRKILDYKSSPTLLSNLKKSEFTFDWLSAKFSVESNIDSNKTSFTVSMRARKDSSIWMSISPALGIEAARMIITRDSLKFMDRINSTYFVGDYNYISKLLHTELDFQMIQSLLVGNSVDFYEEEEKLRASIDENMYLLSTIRKRKLRRAIIKNKEFKDPVQRLWLDPEIFKISKILINDFNTNRVFEGKFGKFTLVDSLYFPFEVNFNVKAEKNISLNLSYLKVVRNKPQSFPFSIPEKYKPVKNKEN